MSAGTAGAGGSSALGNDRADGDLLDRVAAVFDAMQDGVTVQAADGRLVYANDAAARACGFEDGPSLVAATGREILGRFEILDADGRPVPHDELPGRQALSGEPSPRRMLRYRSRRTGDERWAEVNATPLFAGDGSVQFAVNVIHDVTDLKRTEAQLRRARENLEERIRERALDLSLLQRLIDASTDGVFVVDPETGRFEHVNRTAAERLGYAPDDLVGMRLADVREDLDDPRAWDRFVRAARQPGGALLEGTHRREDGSSFPVEANVRLVREADGEHLIAITRDITDRKRTEAELRRSNRELEEFAHAISHDLQEPLRLVAGYLFLLATEHADALDEGAVAMLSHAREATVDMKGMIDDLLEYARLDTEAGFEPVDLGQTLANVLDQLRLRVEETAATITADPLPVVRARPHQMVQLFQNLLSNALKFHRPGVPPRVHVSSRRLDGGWEITVEDEGVGIEPEEADAVFGVFQRLGQADDVEGTGLGLALCRRVVEGHGGTIEAEPKRGDGTVFRVRLPDAPVARQR